MKESTKTTLMAIVAPLLSGIIAVSCTQEKEIVSELSFSEQMDIKYAHVIAHNDSVAALWKEMEDTSVDLDSVLNSPYVYIPDSSKIIAIKYPDDEFTDFEEAFAKAREDLGPNKHFIWRDKIYSTNYKEEGYPPWTYQPKSSMDQQ